MYVIHANLPYEIELVKYKRRNEDKYFCLTWLMQWNTFKRYKYFSFQMTRVCLATSTSLLNDLVEKTLTLYTKRQSPVPGLLLSAVEAGSNIVKAVSMAAASQNDLWFYREKLTQSIQLVELFLRVCIWFDCLLFYFISRIFGYPVNNGRFWIW